MTTKWNRVRQYGYGAADVRTIADLEEWFNGALASAHLAIRDLFTTGALIWYAALRVRANRSPAAVPPPHPGPGSAPGPVSGLDSAARAYGSTRRPAGHLRPMDE